MCLYNLHGAGWYSIDPKAYIFLFIACQFLEHILPFVIVPMFLPPFYRMITMDVAHICSEGDARDTMLFYAATNYVSTGNSPRQLNIFHIMSKLYCEMSA